MLQVLLSVCLVFVSSDSVDVEVEGLLEDVRSEYGAKRIKSLMKMGELVAGLDEPDQGNVARAIVEGASDGKELVRSAAKIQIAENAQIINRYLDTFLKSDTALEYAKACEAIKAIGPVARIWMPLLKKHASSKDRHFLMSTLHAFSALDKKDLLTVLDPTIKALDHKDFNVQWSACRVLSIIGPDAKKAGPRLVRLQKEGIASARSWASIALGAIGPHEDYDVVALLEERLEFFYLIDRERALKGLAMLGDKAKSTLPKIEMLMKTRAKSVQHIASKTHWKITGDPKLAVERLSTLVGTMEYGTESMDILAEIGADAKAAVPALIKQLKSSEDAHREAAIYALASIGPAASDAVVELKKLNQDVDLLIRAAAVRAIQSIQSPEVSKEPAK